MISMNELGFDYPLNDYDALDAWQIKERDAAIKTAAAMVITAHLLKLDCGGIMLTQDVQGNVGLDSDLIEEINQAVASLDRADAASNHLLRLYAIVLVAAEAVHGTVYGTIAGSENLIAIVNHILASSSPHESLSEVGDEAQRGLVSAYIDALAREAQALLEGKEHKVEIIESAIFDNGWLDGTDLQYIASMLCDEDCVV